MKARRILIAALVAAALAIGAASYWAYALRNGLRPPDRVLADLLGGKSGRTLVKTGEIPIDFEPADGFAVSSGLIVKCDAEMVKAYDRTGSLRWQFGFKAAGTLLVRTAGSWVLVADVGGNRILLVRNGAKVSEALLEHTIKNADISASGRVAVIRDDIENKNAVVLLDKDLKETCVRYFVDRYIVSARFAGSGRMLLVCSADLNGASVVSDFEFIGLDGKTSGQTVRKEGAVYPGVELTGRESAILVNAKGLFSLDRATGERWTVDRPDGEILAFTAYAGGRIALDLRLAAGGSRVEIVDGEGRAVRSFETEDEIGSLRSAGGVFALCEGNVLDLRDGWGRPIDSMRLSSDIREVHFLGYNGIAAVLSDSIAFFRF